MYLIVGLGNPGGKYEGTRHNVGFTAIDFLAAVNKIKVSKLKFRSLFGEGVIGGEKVLLVKPQTYMNLSGEAVRDFAEYYKILPSNIIIIYDDVDLESGRLRIRPDGSAGGHNGMKNILYHLGTEEFPRVRLGVGQPVHPDMELVDHVLGRISGEEGVKITQAIKKLEDAVPVIIKLGVLEAMNRFNGN